MVSTLQRNGNKDKLSTIDFKRDKIGIPGKVVHIDYNHNQSVPLALICYNDGEERYILAPVGLGVGDFIKSGDGAKPKPGNALPLKSIPVGTLIHNIELKPGKGGQLVRAAGGSAKLVNKNSNYAFVLLPSGKVRQVHVQCLATIGQISQAPDQDKKLTKTQYQRQPEPILKVAAVVETISPAETEPVTLVEDNLLTLPLNESTISPIETIDLSVTATEAGTKIRTEVSEAGITKPAPLAIQYPPVTPQLTVSPPSAPPGTTFKVTVTTIPKQQLTLCADKYSPASGWQLWHKKVKTDSEGNASTTISWNYQGKYNVWAVDEATGTKAKPLSVSVQYSPVNPGLTVSPSSGPPGSIFKVSLTAGTPRHRVILHSESYSPASGLQLWHKSVKTDSQGKASIALGWRHRGEYSVWAVDEATGTETKPVQVIIR